MKKLLWFIGFVSLTFSFYGQMNTNTDVRINFSENISWFNFKVSDGTTDRTLNSKINFGFGMDYDINFRNHFYIRPELALQNLGAIAQNNGQILEWELNYVHGSVGSGYSFEKFRLQPFVGAAFYFGYLLNGYQTIGNNYLNIKENQSIKSIDFGVTLNYGLNFQFSEQVGTFVEFRNLYGMNQLETNIEDQTSQELYNRNFSVHFGLKLSLGAFGRI